MGGCWPRDSSRIIGRIPACVSRECRAPSSNTFPAWRDPWTKPCVRRKRRASEISWAWRSRVGQGRGIPATCEGWQPISQSRRLPAGANSYA
eukprot:scaffold86617_cov24-Prasinocladus_malaysianus.AAC.1